MRNVRLSRIKVDWSFMRPMSTPSHDSLADELPSVEAELCYLPPGIDRAEVRVYPPGSGVETVRPELVHVATTIRDARRVSDRLELDEQGFECHAHPSSFSDFYDNVAVRTIYYPEVQAAMRAFTNADEVIVFDHNVRSASRAARGEPGVREPVDQAHNDYTEQSGPARQRDILDKMERRDLARRHFAFVNLWRPIIGPVLDTPLALCDARSVSSGDLIPTDIHHFADDDPTTPGHSGQVYSVRHNPEQQWFFVSKMQPDEALLLKGYDSRTDGRARYVPHTGFRNPACPSEFVPRESIETRTLVVFADTNAWSDR